MWRDFHLTYQKMFLERIVYPAFNVLKCVCVWFLYEWRMWSVICHTKGAILFYSKYKCDKIPFAGTWEHNKAAVCVCVCSILYMCLFVRTCTLFSSQLKHVRKITFSLDHEINSVLISVWKWHRKMYIQNRILNYVLKYHIVQLKYL